MTLAYLEKLNAQQRKAVEHGLCGEVLPLLVIAGAGSGKTDTLAHRVAHLLANGVDPSRVLLLTFSRRAAAEMIRRVERVARRVMGAAAEAMTASLEWAGTFHGIGARLLREHAGAIGLNPSFTIHDRQDSADLMNTCPKRSRLFRHGRAIPSEGNLSLDLFALREFANANRGGHSSPLPVVLGLGGGAQGVVSRLCRDEAAPERARL